MVIEVQRFTTKLTRQSGHVICKVVINRKADRPAYLQLADILRDQIIAGHYDSSGSLPGAEGLSRQHGVSPSVAEQALGTLRIEGWIDTGRGRTSRVIQERERLDVYLRPGASLDTRRATTAEAKRLTLRDGERVTEITYPDGEPEVYPSEGYRFIVPQPG